jgi:hypothetical protein
MKVIEFESSILGPQKGMKMIFFLGGCCKSRQFAVGVLFLFRTIQPPKLATSGLPPSDMLCGGGGGAVLTWIIGERVREVSRERERERERECVCVCPTPAQRAAKHNLLCDAP